MEFAYFIIWIKLLGARNWNLGIYIINLNM